MHDPSSPEALPEHVAANREAWDRYATEYVEPGRRAWASPEPTWGIWGVPESELRLLPDDLEGKDAVELGCGTAYVSAWLARRGARPVGIDNSPKQLETARRFQREFGLEFPVHLGNAEATPFEDASFDFAISEYGAALWADPYAWIPEAARLLRPGGRLVFLTNGLILHLCVEEYEANDPAKEALRRPLFGLHRTVWPDDTSVEFHLPHGEWIRLLRAHGFEIERLVEIQAPPDAVDGPGNPFVSADWARKWPSEEAWVVRKRG
ncbi:MAG TPA: class I SAM-dependent methyltransferase [Candidatus Limnocylindrales bacterium]|nr:class I SAM-dependent methyltransferase [Candidatus Limnocylindrales bacterium]